MAADVSPPAHLASETAAWWLEVVEEFELESHQERLLTLACEAFDRSVQAREMLAADGITTTDRFGQVKAHPAVAIERDARLAFARLVRELALDDAGVPEQRPPRIGGRA